MALTESSKKERKEREGERERFSEQSVRLIDTNKGQNVISKVMF